MSIIDGATARESAMNPTTHQKWLDIGKVYIESYLEIINIIEY